MQEMQAAFLADAPRRIQNLRYDLNRLRVAHPIEHPELIRKLFRQLHTLKGSAAAFDFAAVSEIAHELENFLEIIKAENFAEFIAVLEEGFGEIEAAFAGTAVKSLSLKAGQKLENWRAFRQSANQNKVEIADKISLPFDLEKQLNSTEIERLRSALKTNSTLAVVSVKFTAVDFAAGFVQTQTWLNQRGEIVAVLPDAAKTNGSEIALRLIYVCNEQTEKIASILNDTNIEITEAHSLQKSASREVANNLTSENYCHRTQPFDYLTKTKLSNLWTQASLAGQKTALARGKKVDFQHCENAEILIAGERAEACEIALLHIARNAAAHGIEAPDERRANGKNESGTIRLEVKRENDLLCLQISDDGRGIESEKIWSLAKEKNLIAENLSFDEKKAWQIIFLPGFSTAAAVTEDAGRGVGLDAVETAVRAIGGTIEASSERARGTTFYIRFPASDENLQN